MRQKGDTTFIDLLNKVRIADINRDYENLLKSKFVKPEGEKYPHHAIHIWAENSPVNKHNALMLSNVANPLCVINAIDILPKNIQQSVINKVLNRNQMETGGLARILELKVNARVMLTSNIDVLDKRSNGQIGTVFHIKLDSNQAVTKNEVFSQFYVLSNYTNATITKTHFSDHDAVKITLKRTFIEDK